MHKKLIFLLSIVGLFQSIPSPQPPQGILRVV